MAAKGARAKQEIAEQLFELFPYAFEYGKDIRIPWTEDGNQVEIKLTMTCAKTNVADAVFEQAEAAAQGTPTESSEPTKEEINQVAALMDRLGL